MSDIFGYGVYIPQNKNRGDMSLKLLPYQGKTQAHTNTQTLDINKNMLLRRLCKHTHRFHQISLFAVSPNLHIFQLRGYKNKAKIN